MLENNKTIKTVVPSDQEETYVYTAAYCINENELNSLEDLKDKVEILEAKVHALNITEAETRGRNGVLATVAITAMAILQGLFFLFLQNYMDSDHSTKSASMYMIDWNAVTILEPTHQPEKLNVS